jgi:hypothetical protein
MQVFTRSFFYNKIGLLKHGSNYYRAVIGLERMEGMHTIDKELLKAIAGAIESIVK